MLRRFLLFFVPLCFLFAAQVQAQTPTQQQMEFFKSLPADQQQALAAQYGITLPSAISSANTQSYQEVSVVSPRQTTELEDESKNNLNTIDAVTDEKKGLTRFGVELFASSPSTFAPISDVPIPSNYNIGAGDEFIIQLFGKENATHRLTVNREGLVQFPSLGPIQVAGMTFSQAQEALTQRISEQIIGVRSNISLGKLRSMQIFVMGEAYKPGAYTVSALTTISQAIYYSGGFSEKGALRNVQLKRDGKVIRQLDLYDLLLKGDTSNDVRLLAGDVVLINPVKDLVSIQGEINRPAVYELKKGETLSDLLYVAGGVTANAYLEQVNIKRYHATNERNLMTLDITTPKALNTQLQQGDSIELDSRSEKLTSYVQLQGDVQRAGYLAWHSGLTIADLFSSLESGVNETTDVNYSLVVREVNEKKEIQVLQFNLASAILNPQGKDNLRLENRDTLLIFNRFNMLEQQKPEDEVIQDGSETASLVTAQTAERQKNTRQALLAPVLLQLRQQAKLGVPPQVADIFGEVHHPGSYPLVKGMTLAQLVSAAGGLTYEAYTQNAELGRLKEDKYTEAVTTDIYAINLRQALEQNESHNLTLMAGDRLNVFEKPDAKYTAKVTLKGEVRFPGTYTVRRGETLGGLIQRAGGLTDYAHPQGAIFTREELRKQEQKLLEQYAEDIRRETAKQTFRVDKNMASSISDPDKTLKFVEEAVRSKALGRMVVQLSQILSQDVTADFMLEDGDFLYVPIYRNTVSIMGEVQMPITYPLDRSLDVDEYINRAGGMKKQADEDRVFVVRADGSIYKPTSGFWFGNNKQDLRAGDTIIVPLDTDYRDALSFWSAATQILYQTGVAVNALK